MKNLTKKRIKQLAEILSQKGWSQSDASEVKSFGLEFLHFKKEVSTETFFDKDKNEVQPIGKFLMFTYSKSLNSFSINYSFKCQKRNYRCREFHGDTLERSYQYSDNFKEVIQISKHSKLF